MVLILEDWHWVDEASESALKHIVSLISSHPVLVLVVYRPDYSANWGNWSHHTPIILNAFDEPGCENFIKSVWQTDHLPEGFAALIHERTGGNPFFMEEICSAFTEDGTVQIKDRQAILIHSLENITLPRTVQAVIRARLDRLERHSHESLRLASVIGREFTRRILEQISSSRERLSQSLEELKILELIQQTRVIPEAEYMFKHIITQEVTYETLLKQKRKELHGLVGRAIEELYADRLEEFYEMLAFHFWRGEDWPRAYKYNREAGLKAQSFSAYQEAFNFIKAALDALKKLPRTGKHLEQEIDLRFNMRSALFPLGRHDDWAEHVHKAELLARKISDNARLAACYNYLTSYHFIQGRHKEAIRVGEEGLRLAESAGDFSIKITTKFHLAIPLFNTGQIERSVELNREVAEQLSGPVALERHGLTSVPSAVTRGMLAWGLSELGEFEEAETWAQQGIELAEQVKNVFSTALVCACSGFAYLRHGSLDAAMKVLQKADRVGREADLQSILSYIAGSLGDVYLLLGRPDDALPILEEATEPQKLDSSVISTIHPISVLAEAYRLTGQITKAVETAEKALRVFRQTEEICFGAWALYVMSKIQSENGSEQIEQATHTYRRAISLAEELKMRPLLAHCCLDLGKFHIKRGRIKEARTELMNAIDLYRSLDMRFWQPKAEALLSELS